MSRKLLLFAVFLTISIASVQAQRSTFLQNMRFGFGGGINFSHVNTSGEYILYEDLAGNTITNEYSPLFQNFGYQYFFQAEYYRDWLAVSLKPGTYSYQFARQSTLVFENSEVPQENNFRLRYFGLPLEVKYVVTTRGIEPYIGGAVTYETMLGESDTDNTSFIMTRLSLGGVTGFYYKIGSMTSVLSLGYNYGLHYITKKDNRYNTSISNSYSQDDIRLNNLYMNISILFSLEKNRRTANIECYY